MDTPRRKAQFTSPKANQAHLQLFFNPMSRWAIAPVFQLHDIRREPGLSPFGYPLVSLEDMIPMRLSRFDRQNGVQGYGSSKALDCTKPGFLQQSSVFGQRSLSAFRADNHV